MPVKTKRKQRFKENLGEKIGGLDELLNSTSLQGIWEGMIEEQAFKQEEGDFKKPSAVDAYFWPQKLEKYSHLKVKRIKIMLTVKLESFKNAFRGIHMP